MSRLSVCMATRNGSRFVARQMESILRQLGPDDEVVVSDDSSSDDTIAVIRSFGDERIRIFPDNRFSSPVYNFENALVHARGDIIALADQDDVWLDGKVARIKEAMASRPERYYLLVMNGRIVDEAEQLIEASIFARTRGRRGLLKNWFDNSYMGCCMAFRRDLLELALPFPPRLPMHDWWLGLLCDARGMVEFMPEPTMLYRRHGGTVTDLRRRIRLFRQVGSRLLMAAYLVIRLTRHFIGAKKGTT